MDAVFFPVKNYIQSRLQQGLEKYVVNVDLDALGLYGGGLVLRDLELRRDALETTLGLPPTLAITRGFVKELRIVVPWTHLLTSPITVELKTLEIVIQDRVDIPTNLPPKPLPTKSPFKTSSTDSNNTESSSWLIKMFSRIVADTSVEISNLVFKYERDNVVLSTSIKSISLASCDPEASWERKSMSPLGPFEAFFKSIDVDGLTINLDRVDLVKKRAITFEVPILQRAAVAIRLCLHLEPNAQETAAATVDASSTATTPPPPSTSRNGGGGVGDDDQMDSSPPSRSRSRSSYHNLPTLLTDTLQRVSSLGALSRPIPPPPQLPPSLTTTTAPPQDASAKTDPYPITRSWDPWAHPTANVLVVVDVLISRLNVSVSEKQLEMFEDLARPRPSAPAITTSSDSSSPSRISSPAVPMTTTAAPPTLPPPAKKSSWGGWVWDVVTGSSSSTTSDNGDGDVASKDNLPRPHSITLGVRVQESSLSLLLHSGVATPSTPASSPPAAAVRNSTTYVPVPTPKGVVFIEGATTSSNVASPSNGGTSSTLSRQSRHVPFVICRVSEILIELGTILTSPSMEISLLLDVGKVEALRWSRINLEQDTLDSTTPFLACMPCDDQYAKTNAHPLAYWTLFSSLPAVTTRQPCFRMMIGGKLQELVKMHVSGGKLDFTSDALLVEGLCRFLGADRPDSIANSQQELDKIKKRSLTALASKQSELVAYEVLGSFAHVRVVCVDGLQRAAAVGLDVDDVAMIGNQNNFMVTIGQGGLMIENDGAKHWLVYVRRALGGFPHILVTFEELSVKALSLINLRLVKNTIDDVIAPLTSRREERRIWSSSLFADVREDSTSSSSTSNAALFELSTIQIMAHDGKFQQHDQHDGDLQLGSISILYVTNRVRTAFASKSSPDTFLTVSWRHRPHAANVYSMKMSSAEVDYDVWPNMLELAEVCLRRHPGKRQGATMALESDGPSAPSPIQPSATIVSLDVEPVVFSSSNGQCEIRTPVVAVRTVSNQAGRVSYEWTIQGARLVTCQKPVLPDFAARGTAVATPHSLDVQVRIEPIIVDIDPTQVEVLLGIPLLKLPGMSSSSSSTRTTAPPPPPTSPIGIRIDVLLSKLSFAIHHDSNVVVAFDPTVAAKPDSTTVHVSGASIMVSQSSIGDMLTSGCVESFAIIERSGSHASNHLVAFTQPSSLPDVSASPSSCCVCWVVDTGKDHLDLWLRSSQLTVCPRAQGWDGLVRLINTASAIVAAPRPKTSSHHISSRSEPLRLTLSVMVKGPVRITLPAQSPFVEHDVFVIMCRDGWYLESDGATHSPPPIIPAGGWFNMAPTSMEHTVTINSKTGTTECCRFRPHIDISSSQLQVVLQDVIVTTSPSEAMALRQAMWGSLMYEYSMDGLGKVFDSATTAARYSAKPPPEQLLSKKTSQPPLPPPPAMLIHISMSSLMFRVMDDDNNDGALLDIKMNGFAYSIIDGIFKTFVGGVMMQCHNTTVVHLDPRRVSSSLIITETKGSIVIEMLGILSLYVDPTILLTLQQYLAPLPSPPAAATVATSQVVPVVITKRTPTTSIETKLVVSHVNVVFATLSSFHTNRRRRPLAATLSVNEILVSRSRDMNVDASIIGLCVRLPLTYDPNHSHVDDEFIPKTDVRISGHWHSTFQQIAVECPLVSASFGLDHLAVLLCVWQEFTRSQPHTTTTTIPKQEQQQQQQPPSPPLFDSRETLLLSSATFEMLLDRRMEPSVGQLVFTDLTHCDGAPLGQTTTFTHANQKTNAATTLTVTRLYDMPPFLASDSRGGPPRGPQNEWMALAFRCGGPRKIISLIVSPVELSGNILHSVFGDHHGVSVWCQLLCRDAVRGRWIVATDFFVSLKNKGGGDGDSLSSQLASWVEKDIASTTTLPSSDSSSSYLPKQIHIDDMCHESDTWMLRWAVPPNSTTQHGNINSAHRVAISTTMAANIRLVVMRMQPMKPDVTIRVGRLSLRLLHRCGGLSTTRGRIPVSELIRCDLDGLNIRYVESVRERLMSWVIEGCLLQARRYESFTGLDVIKNCPMSFEWSRTAMITSLEFRTGVLNARVSPDAFITLSHAILGLSRDVRDLHVRAKILLENQNLPHGGPVSTIHDFEESACMRVVLVNATGRRVWYDDGHHNDDDPHGGKGGEVLEANRSMAYSWSTCTCALRETVKRRLRFSFDNDDDNVPGRTPWCEPVSLSDHLVRRVLGKFELVVMIQAGDAGVQTIAVLHSPDSFVNGTGVDLEMKMNGGRIEMLPGKTAQLHPVLDGHNVTRCMVSQEERDAGICFRVHGGGGWSKPVLLWQNAHAGTSFETLLEIPRVAGKPLWAWCVATCRVVGNKPAWMEVVLKSSYTVVNETPFHIQVVCRGERRVESLQYALQTVMATPASETWLALDPSPSPRSNLAVVDLPAPPGTTPNAVNPDDAHTLAEELMRGVTVTPPRSSPTSAVAAFPRKRGSSSSIYGGDDEEGAFVLAPQQALEMTLDPMASHALAFRLVEEASEHDELSYPWLRLHSQMVLESTKPISRFVQLSTGMFCARADMHPRSSCRISISPPCIVHNESDATLCFAMGDGMNRMEHVVHKGQSMPFFSPHSMIQVRLDGDFPWSDAINLNKDGDVLIAVPGRPISSSHGTSAKFWVMQLWVHVVCTSTHSRVLTIKPRFAVISKLPFECRVIVLPGVDGGDAITATDGVSLPFSGLMSCYESKKHVAATWFAIVMAETTTYDPSSIVAIRFPETLVDAAIIRKRILLPCVTLTEHTHAIRKGGEVIICDFYETQGTIYARFHLDSSPPVVLRNESHSSFVDFRLASSSSSMAAQQVLLRVPPLTCFPFHWDVLRNCSCAPLSGMAFVDDKVVAHADGNVMDENAFMSDPSATSFCMSIPDTTVPAPSHSSWPVFLSVVAQGNSNNNNKWSNVMVDNEIGEYVVTKKNNEMKLSIFPQVMGGPTLTIRSLDGGEKLLIFRSSPPAASSSSPEDDVVPVVERSSRARTTHVRILCDGINIDMADRVSTRRVGLFAVRGMQMLACKRHDEPDPNSLLAQFSTNHCSNQVTCSVSFMAMQLESAVPSAQFPVVMFAGGSTGDVPILDMTSEFRTLSGWSDVDRICSVNLDCSRVSVNLEDITLKAWSEVLIPMMAVMVADWNSEGKPTHHPQPDFRSLVIANAISLGGLELEVTVRAPTSKSGPFFGLDRTVIGFTPIHARRVRASFEHIKSELLASYLADALLSAPIVLGSLEIFGNPVGFFRAVVHGLRDLITLPLEELKHGFGPGAALRGLVKGWISMVTHVAEGALTSVSGFSNSLARNLDRVNASDKQQQQQQQRRVSLGKVVSLLALPADFVATTTQALMTQAGMKRPMPKSLAIFAGDDVVVVDVEGLVRFKFMPRNERLLFMSPATLEVMDDDGMGVTKTMVRVCLSEGKGVRVFALCAMHAMFGKTELLFVKLEELESVNESLVQDSLAVLVVREAGNLKQLRFMFVSGEARRAFVRILLSEMRI